MFQQMQWIGWAVIYAAVGSLIGTGLILVSSMLIPRLINRMTPQIDEEKEILRGNQAVAEYFGRVVSSSIIGISIIVAASVLGALIAALY